ncbi:hypothetical protein DLM85_24505, partial [Hymenobacter edaphi]
MLTAFGASSLLLLASCNQAAPTEQATADAAQAAATDSTQAAAGAEAPKGVGFGRTADGQQAELYTLRNAHGVQVSITNYGGTITRLFVPDKAGKFGDIVLGFDSVAGYQSPAYRKAGPYFGALIGRYGNRIKAGKFTLNGKSYTLANNNGANHLHGGLKGFDKVLWQAEPGTSAEGPTLKLRYL